MTNVIQNEAVQRINKRLRKMLIAQRHCGICGCDEFDQTNQQDRMGVMLRYGICKSCGLFQLLDCLDDQFVSDFYANLYPRINKNVTSFDPRRFRLQELRGKEAFHNLNRYFSKNHQINCKEFNIVEIGCSAGGVLNYFQKSGCDCVGYDVDQNALFEGKKRYPELDLRNEDFFNNFQRRGDTIFVLSHVLEHFLEPLSFLQKLRGFCQPRDFIYLQVPAIDGYFLNKNTPTWSSIPELAHISYFSKKNTLEILKFAGFESLMTESSHQITVIAKPSVQEILGPLDCSYCITSKTTQALYKIREKNKILNYLFKRQKVRHLVLFFSKLLRRGVSY